MKRTTLLVFLVLVILALSASSVFAGPNCDKDSTQVGNCDKFDQDHNGIPDAGVKVNGHYTSLYAYDLYGGWYWDLGDGRVQGNVGSVSDLDQATLTQCDYVVNYRADFGNDPYMDEGWIINNINCHGYDDNGHYTYLIVSQTDPRYTGNPAWSVWGTWEYHVLVEWKKGNLVSPYKAVGS